MMPETIDTHLIEHALTLVPTCFTIEFDRCLKGLPNAYPNCESVVQAYEGPAGDAMQDAIERIQYCESEQPYIDAALEVMPTCYGPELDHCMESDDPTNDPMPNCATIWQGAILDESIIDDLPFCSEPQPSKPVPWLLIGGGVVLVGVLAFAVGRAK
jgi:hypothetical protein